MIIYNSRNWITNLIHFHKSPSTRKMIVWAVLNGVLALIITVIFNTLLDIHINIDLSVLSVVGVALSILLVFRTNTAYDRWWEGRKLWGSLLNDSRNLAMLVNTILKKEDDEHREFFAKQISNFAIALKDHLRKGVNTKELLHMTKQEIREYEKKQHIPSYLIGMMYERTQKLSEEGKFKDMDMLTIRPILRNFTDILGACERIKKTPIPFSYDIFLKSMIIIYSLLIPFALVTKFGYLTFPIVIFISYVFIGLEVMADEIENPFGEEANDLPLTEIAMTVKNSVYEILCIYKEVDKLEVEMEFENRS